MSFERGNPPVPSEVQQRPSTTAIQRALDLFIDWLEQQALQREDENEDLEHQLPINTEE